MPRRKRVVLATHGTLGDVHPYLAIAVELQKRGHHPIIATSEFYRPNIEAEGVAFHALRPDVPAGDRELHRRFTDPKRGLERIIREFMLPRLGETYDDLLAVVQADGGADLLVSQILIFAAPLIAEKTGIRWISTELQPGAFLSAYDPPVLAPLPQLAKLRGAGVLFHRALFGLAKLTARSWSEPVRRLRRALELPPGKNPLFEGRHSPHLVLALFSGIIGAPQPDWPPNTLVTGFPFHDENQSILPSELAEFLKSGEPPIVFTLGSSAVRDAGSFYIESIGAAQKLGTRAVLLAGDDAGRHLPEPLPEQMIAVPYAPYARVFPHASVVVHQGGVGTTGQTLRAGKPMLVMPFGGDQYDNGARIERMGVGRTIARGEYTAARAAAVLGELLGNHRYRDTAAEIGRHVRAEDGVRTACDAIEAQLSRASRSD
jgi:UDP:flavonoid glycosyltransferase YjiC (YdhE family)